MEDKLAEAVRLQYEAYSYPAPLDDVSKDRLAADPSAARVQIWPCGRFNDDLRILSVGCGTHQAAMIAFHNPGCSVVGIDLSSASLMVSRLGGTQARMKKAAEENQGFATTCQCHLVVIGYLRGSYKRLWLFRYVVSSMRHGFGGRITSRSVVTNSFSASGS